MKHLLSALAIGVLLLSPVAASAHDKHRDRDRHDHDDHHDRDDRHDRGRKRGHHKHDYRRGVVYVERRVYVDDYPRYHLHEPPRGHRWVRSDDGRYVLIAVATGIIADVLLHH